MYILRVCIYNAFFWNEWSKFQLIESLYIFMIPAVLIFRNETRPKHTSRKKKKNNYAWEYREYQDPFHREVTAYIDDARH